MLKELRNERRKVIRRILKKMKPHFYESGYNKHLEPKKGILGKKRPLLLYAPEEFTELRYTYYLQGFFAITEDGIITEALGGGCFLEGFGCFPIEDLLYLEKWIDNHFKENKK